MIPLAHPGGPREKWAALMEETTRRVGSEAEIRALRDDGEALEADVTRCACAELFRQLGEMTRTTTLMEGAGRCDFRWRFTGPR